VYILYIYIVYECIYIFIFSLFINITIYTFISRIIIFLLGTKF